MPQTLAHLLYHVIFSTKDRRTSITQEIRTPLHAYIGGIVKQLGGRAVAVNGTSDHVHVLMALPADVSLADALRLVKTNSSRWVHARWPGNRMFSWQDGYAAFSVSESNAAAVIRYITAQPAHHRKRSFREEYLKFLQRHRVEFDPRYVWG